jgi:hypothetical protein
MTSATLPEFTCQEEAADPEDAEYQRYARDLVDHIVNANRAVLPGIVPADLCVSIEKSYEVNAAAMHTGDLLFARGLLWIVENDAQIASVVAHEIAHAVSQHGIAPNSHDSLLGNQEYRAVCDRLAQIMRKSINESDKDFEESSEIFREVRATLMEEAPDDETREGIGAAFSNHFAIVMAYVGHTVSLSSTRPSEQRKGAYDLLTDTPFDPANRGISARFVASEAIYKNNEDLMRMAQDARLDALEYVQPRFAAKFQAAERQWVLALEKALASSEQFKELSAQKQKFEEAVLGKDVSANWSEQEADEKGLELYIRSGYEPEQFAQMLEGLGNHPPSVPPEYLRGENIEAKGDSGGEVADRLTDHLGQSCERGSSSHPQPCWRADDVRQELIRHKAAYDKIASKRPLSTKFPGRLQKLQETYFTGRPGDPVADQRKDAGSPEVNPSGNESDGSSEPGGGGETSLPTHDTDTDTER